MSEVPRASTPIPDGERIPEALRPHLELGEPNRAILIYTGPVIFSQDGAKFRTEVAVSLRWLPSPAITMEMPVIPSGAHPHLGTFTIQFDEGIDAAHGFVSSLPMFLNQEGSARSLAGIVTKPVVRPADRPAYHARFLLPNLERLVGGGVRHPDGSYRAGRLMLRGGGWVFTLDERDGCKNIQNYIKDNSGFGITYVGRLDRVDKSPFSAKDAAAALDALAWYVSFAAGQWTGPCLATGFDAGGEQVWEEWGYSRTTPFRNRVSWLDHNYSDLFEHPFPGFMSLWLDDTWVEVIRVAIHWYIEANAQAGSIEGSIVLTQTAFELLASAVLTDHEGWLSQEGYDKIAAADRIRLLFLWAGIPTGIPSELGDLVKLAMTYDHLKINNTPDAATAMTAIRNTITHPTRKNREKFSRYSYEARGDAWKLGLRNLELCLLKMFKHEGKYADRIKRKWRGDAESVPWQ